MLLDPWLAASTQPPQLDVLERSETPSVGPAPEATREAENSDTWVVDLSLPEAPFD
jgi:hypothetical protein